MQNLTAVFDDTVRRVREFTYDIEGGDLRSTYSVFAYRKGDANMLVLWRNNDRPGGNPRVEHVTITLPPALWMATPVLVDLRTGKVYEGPVEKGPVEKGPGVKMRFRDVPVYDSPIVLADVDGLPCITFGLAFSPKRSHKTTSALYASRVIRDVMSKVSSDRLTTH